MSSSSSILEGWSAERIKADCRAAYREYHSELRRRHVTWSSAVLGRDSPRQSFVAPTLEAALPERGEHLTTLIPETARHVHNRSAGSSQALALGVLGSAAWGNPNLGWLFEPAGPFPDIGRPLHFQFEYSVGFGLLNEVPRTTDLDFFVSGTTGVVALEAKYTEEGLGTCSCPGPPRGDANSASSTGPTGRSHETSSASTGQPRAASANSASPTRRSEMSLRASSSQDCARRPPADFSTTSGTRTSLGRKLAPGPEGRHPQATPWRDQTASCSVPSHGRSSFRFYPLAAEPTFSRGRERSTTSRDRASTSHGR